MIYRDAVWHERVTARLKWIIKKSLWTFNNQQINILFFVHFCLTIFLIIVAKNLEWNVHMYYSWKSNFGRYNNCSGLYNLFTVQNLLSWRCGRKCDELCMHIIHEYKHKEEQYTIIALGMKKILQINCGRAMIVKRSVILAHNLPGSSNNKSAQNSSLEVAMSCWSHRNIHIHIF